MISLSASEANQYVERDPGAPEPEADASVAPPQDTDHTGQAVVIDDMRRRSPKNGSIHWSPTSGAHAVSGNIRSTWVDQGGFAG